MEIDRPDKASTPMDTDEIQDLPKLMSLNDTMWNLAESASRTPPPTQSVAYIKFKAGFSQWFQKKGSELDAYTELQQCYILFAWASEEFHATSSDQDEAKFYSQWFNMYADCNFDRLWAKTCMILPQGRLKSLLQVNNSWIQPQQFIMVPPVPRDSGNIIADISAL